MGVHPYTIPQLGQHYSVVRLNMSDPIPDSSYMLKAQSENDAVVKKATELFLDETKTVLSVDGESRKHSFGSLTLFEAAVVVLLKHDSVRTFSFQSSITASSAPTLFKKWLGTATGTLKRLLSSKKDETEEEKDSKSLSSDGTKSRICELFCLLMKTKVENLHFDKTNMGDKMVKTLVECALHPDCKLESLHLNHNNIYDEGAIALSHLIERSNLQTLSLEWCGYDRNGVRAICDATANSKTMHTLRLTTTHLGETEAASLAKAMSRLVVLEIGCDFLNDEACDVLSEGIGSSDTLEELVFFDFDVRPSMCFSLARNLRRSFSLSRVDMHKCRVWNRKAKPDEAVVPEEGAAVLSAALGRVKVNSLLFGDLTSNSDTAIYRSFFHAPMYEWHLLPMVAEFVGGSITKVDQ